MDHKSPFSKLVGSTLAHIQSLADDVFHYGFRKLKQLGKDDVVDADAAEKDPGTSSGVVGLVKGVARFLGDSGETYYDTYEKIKAKKAQRAEERHKPKG